ncbi:toll-like receptor 1 [Pangasianodon hypophthalmus]|uniref:toll-like receptor 1 n=1 Tax=Pangasianodon hypophthalmus TaxID=310915 RepID=UPI002307D985|nr:toll-like receptor 1 [Pangasianodon hypophthalmus]
MRCATVSHCRPFCRTFSGTDNAGFFPIILALMQAQGLPWLSVVVLLVSLPHSFLLDMETFILDYSSRNLSAVPPDLPPSIQCLDLSQNRILTLNKHDFHRTPRLHFLNLSWNILEDIHQDTFISTPLLVTLDLSHNRLKKLSHQQYLLQAQNLQYLDLSSNLFAVMALGGEFPKLTKLKWLGLSARTIQNNNFANISDLHLQTLFIQAQNLMGYENGSLTGAKADKIVVLMSNNVFDLPVIADALASFKEVELRGLHDPEDFLGILATRQVRIQTVNLHLSSVWSTWKVITALTNRTLMSSIRQFSLSNLTLHDMMGRYFVVQGYSLDSFSIRQASVTVFLFDQQSLYDFIISIPARNLTFAQTPIVHMTCPKVVSMIQMLDLSDCVLTEKVFKGLHGECNTLINLEVLVLKGNNLRQLMPLTSRVQLMSSLRHVDFSQNSLTYEETQGGCTWPSKITHLDLSFNEFDQTVFKCLPNALVNLNLQNNHISAIPANISGLDSLKILDLTANRLLDLPDCLGYPKLQKLVLRGNFLHAPSTGSLKTCSHLTVVDISMNPYICTCPLREFTNLIDDKGTLGGSNSWKNQRITVAHWPDGYQCSYPEYWRKAMLKNFSLLEITCNAGLLAVTILLPAIILVITVGILCQQLDLPWYMGMIWKWTRAKHRARSSQQRPEDLEGVRYHAFISYSQRNANWVIDQLLPKLEGEDSTTQNGLRVCHHERDFIPGRPILDNILRCIEQSRCCVFVLSSHFVQSDWCHYELYFASHQWITRGMDNIILILLEPLPTYLIPSKYHQLKAMMARRTYLEWPQDKAKQRMFWANLRAALQADLPHSVEREWE